MRRSSRSGSHDSSSSRTVLLLVIILSLRAHGAVGAAAFDGRDATASPASPSPEMFLDLGSPYMLTIATGEQAHFAFALPLHVERVLVELRPESESCDPDLDLSFTTPWPEPSSAAWSLVGSGAETLRLARGDPGVCPRELEPCTLHATVTGFASGSYWLSVEDITLVRAPPPPFLVPPPPPPLSLADFELDLGKPLAGGGASGRGDKVLVNRPGGDSVGQAALDREQREAQAVNARRQATLRVAAVALVTGVVVAACVAMRWVRSGGLKLMDPNSIEFALRREEEEREAAAFYYEEDASLQPWSHDGTAHTHGNLLHAAVNGDSDLLDPPNAASSDEPTHPPLSLRPMPQHPRDVHDQTAAHSSAGPPHGPDDQEEEPGTDRVEVVISPGLPTTPSSYSTTPPTRGNDSVTRHHQHEHQAVNPKDQPGSWVTQSRRSGGAPMH
mmetsp:Transcript_53/g.205  ORF Transcript_53/g.205 Transcript_53/m.205 type:complete len:444 (+) Transcript_53:86-1417(+)